MGERLLYRRLRRRRDRDRRPDGRRCGLLGADAHPDGVRRITEQMYREYRAGASVAEIAQRWGVSRWTVYGRFERVGLKCRTEQVAAETRQMYQRYLDGAPVAAIAQQWGIPKGTVSSRFRRAGLKRNRRKCPDAATLQMMHQQYLAGESIADIARQRDVSTETVRKWFRRAGLTLRRRRCENLEASNPERALAAGRRDAARATAALNSGDALHVEVLRLRADNPTASLAELAAMCDPPMSKDAFHGRLRRALRAV